MGLEVLGLGAAAVLILGGMVWFAAYRQGRNAAKAKDLKESLDAQQRAEDAVAEIRTDAGEFYLDEHGRVRRRQPRETPSVSRRTESDITKTR